MKNPINLICASLLVSGCAAVGSAEDRAADIISRYSERPFSDRLIFRETLNAKLAEIAERNGHKICRVQLDCVGDQ